MRAERAHVVSAAARGEPRGHDGRRAPVVRPRSGRRPHRRSAAGVDRVVAPRAPRIGRVEQRALQRRVRHRLERDPQRGLERLALGKQRLQRRDDRGVREPPIPADAPVARLRSGARAAAGWAAAGRAAWAVTRGRARAAVRGAAAGAVRAPAALLAPALGLRHGAALGDYGPVQVDHRHAVSVHDLHRLLVVFDDHVVDGFVVQHCNDTCDVSETAAVKSSKCRCLTRRGDREQQLGLVARPDHELLRDLLQVGRVNRGVAVLARHDGRAAGREARVQSPIIHQDLGTERRAVRSAKQVVQALQAVGRLLCAAVAAPRRVLHEGLRRHVLGQQRGVADRHAVAHDEHVGQLRREGQGRALLADLAARHSGGAAARGFGRRHAGRADHRPAALVGARVSRGAGREVVGAADRRRRCGSGSPAIVVDAAPAARARRPVLMAAGRAGRAGGRVVGGG